MIFADAAGVDQIAGGQMVVVVDDESRENEGDLVMATEEPCASDFLDCDGECEVSCS